MKKFKPILGILTISALLGLIACFAAGFKWKVFMVVSLAIPAALAGALIVASICAFIFWCFD